MTKMEQLHEDIRVELLRRKITYVKLAKELGLAPSSAQNLKYRINNGKLLNGTTYNNLCKMLWGK